MVEFGTSSAFRGIWVRVRVRVLGYGFEVRDRKVKSRDCALASDLVRAATEWLRVTEKEMTTSGDPDNYKEETWPCILYLFYDGVQPFY